MSNDTPLDPIASTWTTVINAYNYTANPAFPLPNEQFELRLDPNLHHGVEGTTLRLDDIGPSFNKNLVGPLVLDPAVMGPGDHTAMAIWTQPLGTLVPGIQSLASVVVFPVTVGDAVPPPTTCQDPTATNIGGPLPCVFPPPTPIPLTISCTGIGSGFLQIKADGTFSLTNTSGATSCK
jgi:hypothetical protein